MTIVIASNHWEETRIICQQLDSVLGQSAHFVFAGQEESHLSVGVQLWIISNSVVLERYLLWHSELFAEWKRSLERNQPPNEWWWSSFHFD